MVTASRERKPFMGGGARLVGREGDHLGVDAPEGVDDNLALHRLDRIDHHRHRALFGVPEEVRQMCVVPFGAMSVRCCQRFKIVPGCWRPVAGKLRLRAGVRYLVVFAAQRRIIVKHAGALSASRSAPGRAVARFAGNFTTHETRQLGRGGCCTTSVWRV